MTRTGAAAVAAALLIAVASAGCGLGSGERAEGEAGLTVTLDYGAEEIVDVTIADPAPTDTVIRVLDREVEITTRHGGGFVQSIEGVAGGVEGGRSVDWFFYVNGIESPVGSADVAIEPGDRVWWDHHDWTAVMRVPAVVGSFPQPFEAASREGGDPIEVGCGAEPRACETVAAALAAEGIGTRSVESAASEPGSRPRVLVGELSRLLDDRVGELLAAGPQRSGIFARAVAGEAGRERLELVDRAGLVAGGGAGFGLVAATARGAEAPTWLVTGTGPDEVMRAAELLGPSLLRDRFAVAVADDGETIPLPVR